MQKVNIPVVLSPHLSITDEMMRLGLSRICISGNKGGKKHCKKDGNLESGDTYS